MKYYCKTEQQTTIYDYDKWMDQRDTNRKYSDSTRDC